MKNKLQNQDNPSKCLSVFVSGDFCPAYLPEGVLSNELSAKNIFGDLYETIYDADYSITNLECPLTASSESIKKIGPNLKSTSEVANLLREAGFKMVTLANNHVFDYGQKGLEDTLETLKDNKISYVGAGLTLLEAKKTFYKQIKEIKLAIVNFAEVEYSCANEEHGGANPMNLIDNFNQIQEARHQAEHVLVIVHGGHEHYHYPSAETLKRYRFYAEAGASAVIAHHTHCIGGFEKHEGVPIFYGLGNFFFPAHNEMPIFWYEGFAVLLEIANDGIDFEILPYEQCKGGTLYIDRSRSEEIVRKIFDINRILVDEEKLSVMWSKFVEEHSLYYLTKISGLGRYKTAILRRLGLLSYFYQRSQLENVRQMLRCEAHKEAALDALSKYLKKRSHS